MKLKFKSITSLFFLINPWLFVPSYIYSIKFNFSLYNLFFIVGFILFSSIQFYWNLNINIFFNFILLLLYSMSSSSRIKTDFFDSNIFNIYFLFGVFIGFVYFILTDYSRVGLFGGEPNFSSFTALICLILLYESKKLNLIHLFFALTLLLITSSRTFLVMSLFTLFIMKMKRIYIVITLILIFVFIINFALLLQYLENFQFFTASGYIEDYSRLLNFNDSSSLERINIFKENLDLLLGNFKYLLFGVPDYVNLEYSYLLSSKLPHNSFLQVTKDYGLIYLIIILYILIKKLPIKLSAIFLIYGFFLHNIFSLPLILFLSIFYEKK